jgi:hypothetical protein
VLPLPVSLREPPPPHLVVIIEWLQAAPQQ